MTLTAAYWLERAAHVLPGATDDELLRGAELLEQFYDQPTVTYDAHGSTLPTWEYAPGEVKPSLEAEDRRDIKPKTVAAPYLTVLADARAFDGQTGGGVPTFTDAPDAWSAIKHTLSPDGAKVTRRGNARVQGAPFGSAPYLPNGATGALLGQMLEDLPRNSIGAIGWQVSVLTDLFYGPDQDFPRLLGNDGATSGEHVPSHVDLATVRGIVHAQEADQDRRMSWPMRLRLRRVVVRASERCYLTAGALPAPHADPARIFIGHRCYMRGKLARVARNGKRAARTLQLGRVSIDRPEALATVADCMNRGERVAVTYNGLAITVTRATGGTYSATIPNRGKVNGVRTTRNLVKRVSELTA